MDIDVDLRLAWLFMRELAIQSRHALRAFNNLERLGNERLSVSPLHHPEQFFRECDLWNEHAFLVVHSLFTHTGNVSKVLWPTRQRPGHPIPQDARKERAEALRRVLHVSNSSVLRLRTLRDSLEHFDERLETWSLSDDGQNFDLYDMNSAPFGLGLGGPSTDDYMLRTLQWQPLQFRILGSEVDLEAVVNELLHLHEGVVSWQRQAAGTEVKRVNIRREPLDVYSTKPQSDDEAYRHLGAARSLLQDVNVLAAAPDGVFNRLEMYVRDRGWAWEASEAPDPDHLPTVRVIDSERDLTYNVQGWSVENGLVVAVAMLLREEERLEHIESQSRSVLRVNLNGSWTLV